MNDEIENKIVVAAIEGMQYKRRNGRGKRTIKMKKLILIN